MLAFIYLCIFDFFKKNQIRSELALACNRRIYKNIQSHHKNIHYYGLKYSNVRALFEPLTRKQALNNQEALQQPDSESFNT